MSVPTPTPWPNACTTRDPNPNLHHTTPTKANPGFPSPNIYHFLLPSTYHSFLNSSPPTPHSNRPKIPRSYPKPSTKPKTYIFTPTTSHPIFLDHYSSMKRGGFSSQQSATFASQALELHTGIPTPDIQRLIFIYKQHMKMYDPTTDTELFHKHLQINLNGAIPDDLLNDFYQSHYSTDIRFQN